MRSVMKVAVLVGVCLGLSGGRGLGQDDKPFSKRGTPEEREEKLAKTIRAIAKYSFNYSSDSEEVLDLAHKLLEDRPKEVDKVDMGKLVPRAAEAVAKQDPKSFFYFQIPTSDDTPLKKVTDLLGKADRTEKDTITINKAAVPITWHFYGWCGFGVAKNGHVQALKVECKDVPVKKGK